MTKIEKWTVVRHSAWVVNGNPQFQQGLESCLVATKAQWAIVEKAGGLLFDNYGKAEDFAEKAMYPEGHEGLIPAARGTFSDKTIDGREIYVPVRQVMG